MLSINLNALVINSTNSEYSLENDIINKRNNEHCESKVIANTNVKGRQFVYTYGKKYCYLPIFIIIIKYIYFTKNMIMISVMRSDLNDYMHALIL